MTDRLTEFRVMRADLDRVFSFIEDHPTILPEYGEPVIGGAAGGGLRVLIHCLDDAKFTASLVLLRDAGGVETFTKQIGTVTYDKASRQFGTVALELQTVAKEGPAVTVVSDRFASTRGTDAA